MFSSVFAGSDIQDLSHFASYICLTISSHFFLVLSLQVKLSLVWILTLVWLCNPLV